MAEVKPFKGVIFNPEKVDIGKVVSPPYDVISPEEQDELYASHPNNIVRIELGKREDGDNEKVNKYTRARELLYKWLEEEILVRDASDAFYLYQQEYTTPEGELKERLGLVSLVKIEHFDKKTILPHEKTFTKPKEDRYRLLKACQANISQIFGIYRDERVFLKPILKSKCYTALGYIHDFIDKNGVRHTLWRITEKALIEKIKDFFKDRKILLADGHHRYETALRFRDEMRKERGKGPWDYVMMTLAAADENLTILPIHRGLLELPIAELKLLSLLSEPFEVKEASSLSQMLKEKEGESLGLGMAIGDKFYALRLKDKTLPQQKLSHLPKSLRALNVSFLHYYIFKEIIGIEPFDEDKIVFEKDPEVLLKKVKEGTVKVAFFLNPVNFDEIWQVAENGLRLPQKTSFFYPKVWTGLVINIFD
jgi:uncharacterized protein (DUF1015 family)